MLRFTPLALVAVSLAGVTGASAQTSPPPLQQVPRIAPPAPLLVPRMMPPPPAPPPAPGRARPYFRLPSLITPDDYPEAALQAQEQGALTVELEVSVLGRVAGCRIIDSSGSASLDSTTCRILTRRARFWPARDRAGQQVADKIRQRVRWELDALAFAPIDSLAVATFNAIGALERCADVVGLPACAADELSLGQITIALTGAPARSSEIHYRRQFVPDNDRTPLERMPLMSGDRRIFSGTTRIGIANNGKVSDCVEQAPLGPQPGALCRLVSSWLYALDTGPAMIRRGTWRIELRSRAPEEMP